MLAHTGCAGEPVLLEKLVQGTDFSVNSSLCLLVNCFGCIYMYIQVRRELPQLKAIVQYTKKLTDSSKEGIPILEVYTFKSGHSLIRMLLLPLVASLHADWYGSEGGETEGEVEHVGS